MAWWCGEIVEVELVELVIKRLQVWFLGSLHYFVITLGRLYTHVALCL